MILKTNLGPSANLHPNFVASFRYNLLKNKDMGLKTSLVEVLILECVDIWMYNYVCVSNKDGRRRNSYTCYCTWLCSCCAYLIVFIYTETNQPKSHWTMLKVAHSILFGQQVFTFMVHIFKLYHDLWSTSILFSSTFPSVEHCWFCFKAFYSRESCLMSNVSSDMCHIQVQQDFSVTLSDSHSLVCLHSLCSSPTRPNPSISPRYQSKLSGRWCWRCSAESYGGRLLQRAAGVGAHLPATPGWAVPQQPLWGPV